MSNEIEDCDRQPIDQGRAGEHFSTAAPRVFLLTVAYDGTGYSGWQYQPDQPSVQEKLEKALLAVLKQPVRALASSRTDAGVHAVGQAVAVRTTRWNAPADRLPLALNSHLPSSIVVRQSRAARLDFHPLRDSVSKSYRYCIYNSRKDDPIGNRTHWWVKRSINVNAVKEAAQLLLGRQDFASFQSAGSPRSSTIRTIQSLQIDAQPHLDGQMIAVRIQADGFLYNMVRNIVGTLVQVGVGRQAPQWITDVLGSKDRQQAGATAPPQGLTLMEVRFREDIDYIVAQ